jgi:hypothetical protein
MTKKELERIVKECQNAKHHPIFCGIVKIGHKYLCPYAGDVINKEVNESGVNYFEIHYSCTKYKPKEDKNIIRLDIQTI